MYISQATLPYRLVRYAVIAIRKLILDTRIILIIFKIHQKMALAALAALEATPIADEDAHLFVLVHGLWGSPKHMLVVERALKNSLAEVSNERIITLKPSSFRFWKTYDGIERCAERVIADLLYEIEILKEKDHLKVSKISIIGYSLGGLISRFVVGKLFSMGFFDEVSPVFFSTFATPHVGVHFFRPNLFDYVANRLGKLLFGYTGLQLFVADNDSLLVRMADPESAFFQGLELFESRLLLANVKNDRSVAFYTSYITEFSPFDQIDSVNIRYLKDLPPSRIGVTKVWPKFIDMEKSHRVENPEEFQGNRQEATSIIRSNKILRGTILLSAAVILVPFYIPLIICLSLYVSGYSALKVKLLRSMRIEEHWKEVRLSVYHEGVIDSEHAEQGESRRKQRHNLAKHETFKGDTSNFTESAMEGMLFAEDEFVGGQSKIIEENEPSDEEDKDSNKVVCMEAHDEEQAELSESDSNQTNKSLFASFLRKKHIIDILTDKNDRVVREHVESLRNNDLSRIPLFSEESKLDLLEEQKIIVKNLNKLDWIKIAVYHDLFNAHDGIVARRGEKSNPKGTCTIYLWASILRNHIRDHI